MGQKGLRHDVADFVPSESPLAPKQEPAFCEAFRNAEMKQLKDEIAVLRMARTFPDMSEYHWAHFQAACPSYSLQSGCVRFLNIEIYRWAKEKYGPGCGRHGVPVVLCGSGTQGT